MSPDEKASEAGAFAKEVRATFPVVHDVKLSLHNACKVEGAPTNLVIDRSGKIVYSKAGEDVPSLEAAVAKAMK